MYPQTGLQIHYVAQASLKIIILLLPHQACLLALCLDTLPASSPTGLTR